MDDVAARIVAVGAVTASALGVAAAAPRLSALRAERTPLDLSGIDASILFFSDRSCARCDAVRLILHEAGIAAAEITFEEDPARWRRIGVGAVPLVVVRDSEGRVVAAIGGLPSRRRLLRALRRSGVGGMP